MCSLCPPGFPAVTRDGLHTFDMDALPSSRSKSLSLRCVDAGCLPHTPPRMEDFAVAGPLVPGGPTSPLRFLCVAPPLWMGLPSDPTARRAPWPFASPLAARTPGARTFTLLALCHARHTRQSSAAAGHRTA
jgi:hypothetical protein